MIPPFHIASLRDIVWLRPRGAGNGFLVACDSLGGIGSKPGDVVSCPPEVVGYGCARVALMEALAAGGEPILVVDTLSVERFPTGEALLHGVRQALAEAGVPAHACTGSTEDNIPTLQTGMGVTVVACLGDAPPRVGVARPGQKLVLVGHPCSAPEDEVRFDDPRLLTFAALRHLLQFPGVGEIAPLGSGGARPEGEGMAKACGGQVVWEAEALPWVDRSGGPCTAALISVDAGALPALKASLTLPLCLVGELVW